MARLTFSPLAEADLNEILEFIARDKPKAAVSWIQKIRDTCERLSRQPEIGERRPEFTLERFAAVSSEST
jgi:toxin ParE1/3/4